MNSSTTPHRGLRFVRRLLLTLAIMATVIAVFYTEENWRGKRDWERYKSELEAQGWVLDWNQRMPKPVPDDQNFFMASTNIRIRFVKTQNDTEYAAATNLNWLSSNYKNFPEQVFTKTNEPIVAELTVIIPDQKNTTLTNGDNTIDLRQANAGETLRNLIRQHCGESFVGSAGFNFSEKDPRHLTPLHITLLASAPPTGEALRQLIPTNLLTNIGGLGISGGDQPNQFEVRIVSGKCIPAADYLQWMNQFDPAFAEIREALKRPYALIPGDFSEPHLIPIPNFVVLRWLAQNLAMQAQCHLLSQDPGAALADLTLMHDVCRILEHRPDSHPMTLVEAMINVAIQNVYVVAIQDGLRTHAWRESDLAAIQKQLAQTDLHSSVAAAFEDEHIYSIRVGERREFIKILLSEITRNGQPLSFPDRLKAWGYRIMPQGWVYENIKVASELNHTAFSILSLTNQQVYPAIAADNETEIKTVLGRTSPFNLLASIAIPNFTKAFENYAYNQTLVNEGQVACALERYHLANGAYPETLDQLIPNFIETLPPDVIGGQPLKYHRTDDGSFLLYSVGWNEQDDGGITGRDKQGNEDRNQGDWVWHYPKN